MKHNIENREMYWWNGLMLWLMIIAVIFSLWATSARAQESASRTPGFNSFKILLERNIFDPNRYPNKPKQLEQVKVKAPRQVEIDSLTVTGALISGATTMAFFEGSQSEYERTVSVGSKIAGCLIMEINTNYVKLDVDGKLLELPISSHLVRRDQGEWEVTAASDFPNEQTEAEDNNESDNSTQDKKWNKNKKQDKVKKTHKKNGDDKNKSVLEKLMEKRRRELE
jgi:hypothetical protein